MQDNQLLIVGFAWSKTIPFDKRTSPRQFLHVGQDYMFNDSF